MDNLEIKTIRILPAFGVFYPLFIIVLKRSLNGGGRDPLLTFLTTLSIYNKEYLNGNVWRYKGLIHKLEFYSNFTTGLSHVSGWHGLKLEFNSNFTTSLSHVSGRHGLILENYNIIIWKNYTFKITLILFENLHMCKTFKAGPSGL